MVMMVPSCSSLIIRFDEMIPLFIVGSNVKFDNCRWFVEFIVPINEFIVFVL